MSIEKPPDFENKESVIDGLIEALAEREGMNFQDIISDIITFAELSKEDESVKSYLEEVAEKVGISYDEIVAYAIKKSEQ